MIVKNHSAHRHTSHQSEWYQYLKHSASHHYSMYTYMRYTKAIAKQNKVRFLEPGVFYVSINSVIKASKWLPFPSLLDTFYHCLLWYYNGWGKHGNKCQKYMSVANSLIVTSQMRQASAISQSRDLVNDRPLWTIGVSNKRQLYCFSTEDVANYKESIDAPRYWALYY